MQNNKRGCENSPEIFQRYFIVSSSAIHFASPSGEVDFAKQKTEGLLGKNLL